MGLQKRWVIALEDPGRIRATTASKPKKLGISNKVFMALEEVQYIKAFRDDIVASLDAEQAGLPDDLDALAIFKHVLHASAHEHSGALGAGSGIPTPSLPTPQARATAPSPDSRASGKATRPHTRIGGDCEIGSADLTVGKKIANGNFGTVFQAVWAIRLAGGARSVDVAASVPSSNNSAFEHYEAVWSTFSTLNHLHIISCFGIMRGETADSPPTYVMELAPLGELLRHLRRSGMQSTKSYVTIVTSNNQKDYIWQIANAMHYLASRGIVHPNLCARNVMAVSEAIVKLKMFKIGESDPVDDDPYSVSGGGPTKTLPVKWTSPEALENGNAELTEASNVWSFGITVWEILTGGKMPYAGMTNAETRKAVCDCYDGYRMPQPNGCSQELYQLMLECWNHDRDDRPTFSDIVAYLGEYLRRSPIGDGGSDATTVFALSKRRVTHEALVAAQATTPHDIGGDPDLVEWAIPPKSVTRGDQIGKGMFGQVFRGAYLSGARTETVALKLFVGDGRDAAANKVFALETKTMIRLHVNRHANVVNLIGICLKSPRYIITELVEQLTLPGKGGAHLGNILAAVKSNTWLRFDEQLALLSDVSSGMRHLASCRIIHRDLACRNCLLGRDNRVKICDFGHARAITQDETYYGEPGERIAIPWSAPESIRGDSPAYSEKSDVWSFAMTALEVLQYGDPPFGRMVGWAGRELVRERIVAGKDLPQCPRLHCPAPFYALQDECLQLDPAARPAFASIAQRLQAIQKAARELHTDSLESKGTSRMLADMIRTSTSGAARDAMVGTSGEDESPVLCGRFFKANRAKIPTLRVEFFVAPSKIRWNPVGRGRGGELIVTASMQFEPRDSIIVVTDPGGRKRNRELKRLFTGSDEVARAWCMELTEHTKFLVACAEKTGSVA